MHRLGTYCHVQLQQLRKRNYCPASHRNNHLKINPAAMLVKMLSAYKNVVLKAIITANTPDELTVCWGLMVAFNNNYHGEISSEELKKHLLDIESFYKQKMETFFTP